MNADLDALDLESDAPETTTEAAPVTETAPATEARRPTQEDPDDDPDSGDDTPPEAPEDPEEPEAAQPADADPAPPVTDPDLPEGVQVRTKANGKKEWAWPETRARSIYDGYKSAQSAEDVFGEPLTPELAQQRQDAFNDHESMLADYLSGDEAGQGRFLKQLAHWAGAARKSGEVQHDPLKTLASRLPAFLQEAGGQETFDALAAPVIRTQLDALYAEALGEDQKNLLASLQHLDLRLFGTYRKRADIQPPDPLAEREKAIAKREETLAERERTNTRGAFEEWQNKAALDIRAVVQDAIGERLGPNIVKSYEKFPTDFAAVKELLRKDLQDRLSKDRAWQEEVNRHVARASNAANGEQRDQIREALKARYKAKAMFWISPERNPKVAEILKQRAAVIQQNSQAKHQRLQAGAERRTPGSTGAPVKPSLAATPNGGSTADAWRAAIDAL